MSPRLIRLGRGFALAWLSILVFPIYAILFGHEFDVRTQIIALPLVGGIALAYGWFWVRVVGSGDRRAAAANVVVFTILLTAFTLGTPPKYGSLFVFGTVVAGAAFEWRLGIATVITISLFGVGCDMIRGVAPLGVAGQFLNDILAGLAGVGGRLLFAAYRRLSAAGEQIAQLAVDEERLRFARDLHDLLGHSLSVIALKSELAGRLIGQSPGLAEHEIRGVERVARQALREVRDAVSDYRQPTLATELAGAQAALAAAGIECRIEQKTGALPPAVEAVLAWTIREGATNVIRHSQAHRCSIRVAASDGRVQVDVVDDGRGGTPGTGSGLQGLTERVLQREGELQAEPLPHEGFRLRVTLPIGLS